MIATWKAFIAAGACFQRIKTLVAGRQPAVPPTLSRTQLVTCYVLPSVEMMLAIRVRFIGILAMCVAGASALTLAQQVATTSAIRDVRPVAFPPYTANRRIALFVPTAEEYAQAVGDRAFVIERVTYRSDDLDVFAYLYRPVARPKDKKLPVVDPTRLFL